GKVGVRVHHPAQPGRALRAARDTRGSALRARGLRRATQSARRGEAVTRWLTGSAAFALGFMVTALWLGLDARVPAPPAFESVRAQWRPSAASLLDRSGEGRHE